jgi:hypothetical protein
VTDLRDQVSTDAVTASLGRRATRRAVLAGSAASAAVAMTASTLGHAAASSVGGGKGITGRAQDDKTLVYALGFDVDDTLDPQVTSTRR